MVIPVRVPTYAPTYIVANDIVLSEDHPLIGMPCPVCDADFAAGDPLALVLIGVAPEDRGVAPLGMPSGGYLTASSVAVHLTCTTPATWQQDGPPPTPPPPAPQAVQDVPAPGDVL